MSAKMKCEESETVLIKKADLQKLKEHQLFGVWWSMSVLEQRINRKQKWIKENILFQPQFRKVLDIENGGFVFYPKHKGQQWSFQAMKMSKFLDDYFIEIHKQF